jgi:hypothetical protein
MALIRRRIEQLSRPRTYSELATDAAWWMRPLTTKPVAPSWHPDPRALAEAEIRWPTAYENPIWERGWPEAVRANMARLLPVVRADVPQPYPGIIVFQFVRAGRTHDVVLDYYDYMHLNEAALGECSLYFKMQHSRHGYPSEKVLPGGYFHQFGRQWVRSLPHARRMRDARAFRYDVYGRFSSLFAREVRTRAVELLRDQRRFGFEGSLHTVPFGEFLREIAGSKVCLDLPGNGPLCVRLCNYLGVGACVVAVPHEAVLHVPLEDGREIAYCRPDLSDLVDLCAYYVEHPSDREALYARGREYFDRHLTWPQLARYYLASLVERLA